MAKKKKGTKKIGARARARGVTPPSPQPSLPSGRGSRTPLARELLGLYQALGRLSRATKVKAEREELRAQQRAIGVLIDRVIERTIREDTRDYAEATASLAAAATRVEEAMEDVRGVIGAIVAAARVVDAVGRVLG